MIQTERVRAAGVACGRDLSRRRVALTLLTVLRSQVSRRRAMRRETTTRGTESAYADQTDSFPDVVDTARSRRAFRRSSVLNLARSCRMVERDLQRLLSGLQPELSPDEWVFATTVDQARVPGRPFATIEEQEGLTLVLCREDADRLGLSYDYVAARITLGIDSDLASVGLTAAVSSRLASTGISCNVIAGFHHDHLFVPHDRGPDALHLLEQLAVEAASGE